MSFAGRIGVAGIGLAVALTLVGCERPPMETEQIGYRGVGMEKVTNPRLAADSEAANAVPVATPKASADGPKAGQIYQNVQVLGDLSVGQFARLMTAITAWVSPEQGCNYCHEAADLASDALYTKVVSRRMIQMTQHINSEWTEHHGGTGVTCYTCHRGKNVPAEIWFEAQGPKQAAAAAGYRDGQNYASRSVGYTSLPYDPFSTYFNADPKSIRVNSATGLPSGTETTIMDAEHTYGLMMHMSTGLGVNCTHCHNSRVFASWEESTPQRIQAWHGIQMVRDLNTAYLDPLKPVYPEKRLGPSGDAPKGNCATCHQGVNKPLYGVNMVQDYPSLNPGG